MFERSTETPPWDEQIRQDDILYRRQVAYLFERSHFFRSKLTEAGFMTDEDVGGLGSIARLPLTPLPVTVELARDAPADPALGESIQQIRDVLVFAARVEPVPWGTLQRSEYKSKLVQR